LSSAVDWKKTEALFRKGPNPEIDRHSTFYDNRHLKSTGLAGYLKERNVTEVYITGLAADYCVYYSAKDALREGFQTYVIEDATRATSEAGFIAAQKNLKEKGGKLIQSWRL
jgi:nicotinamidase/pyrazinamidase